MDNKQTKNFNIEDQEKQAETFLDDFTETYDFLHGRPRSPYMPIVLANAISLIFKFSF